MLSYDELADHPVFVYGTLQRGEERERLWPCRPLQVAVATVAGYLYDLGPYPALTVGSDKVLGELWYVPHSDLPGVLQTLDAVEGYRGRADDLYERRLVSCQEVEHDRAPVRAYAYYFTQIGRLQRGLRVRPNAAGYCCWHRFRSECAGLEG